MTDITAQVKTGVVYKGKTAVLLGTALDLDGEPIVQADVSTITYTVRDLQEEENVSGHDNASLSASNVIFDELQTPNAWSVDDEGFNFRHILAGTAFPEGDRYYQYDATITLTDGTKSPVVFILECKQTYSS